MIQPISNYKNKNINFNKSENKREYYEYGSQKFFITNNKLNRDNFINKKSDKIKAFLTLFFGLSALAIGIFYKPKLL